MTLPSPGPAAQAWMEAGRKTSKATIQRMMRTAAFAMLLYVLFQLGLHLGQINSAMVKLSVFMYREVFPSHWVDAETLTRVDVLDQGVRHEPWDFTLGIADEHAVTIVSGLSAIVFAINVAVFAARLGRTTDLRGEMDIVQWQRVMEIIAPVAAIAALAVAGTRFPQKAGLGIALVVVALIALVASDVRIAGRLGALDAEAGAARLLHLQAQDRLKDFSESLPQWLKTMLQAKPRSPGIFLLFHMMWAFGFMACQANLSVHVMYLVQLDVDEVQALIAPDSPLSWVFLMTILGLLGLGETARIRLRRTAQVLSGTSAAVVSLTGLWRTELTILVVVPLVEVLMMPEQLRLPLGLLSLITLLAWYFFLRASPAYGSGPGIYIVLFELTRLRAAADTAALRAAAAAEDFAAETALHAALAPSESDSVINASGSKKSILGLMRRTFLKE